MLVVTTEMTCGGLMEAGRSDIRQKKTVVVCDTQPVAAEGLRALASASGEMEVGRPSASLAEAIHDAEACGAAVCILDKAFGLSAVVDALAALRQIEPSPSVLVWGVSFTEAEALRLLQAGARGIIRKAAELDSILACLRAVAAGQSWIEEAVLRDRERGGHYGHSELTPRERQVVMLVEQGFKNKEIAGELGIRPGTVKIHLKHIFEKTGVRGRYSLALNGLRDRGVVSATLVEAE